MAGQQNKKFNLHIGIDEELFQAVKLDTTLYITDVLGNNYFYELERDKN